MVLSFFHWLQNTGFGTAIRESALVYPIIMTLHLTAMALFGGLILMTDMRLLGLAMRNRPIGDVVGQLRIWKRIGFVMVVTCGALLLWAKAETYYHNPFFWMKMLFLSLVAVHALIFRPLVYNRAAEFDKMPSVPPIAKLAASLSLALWIGLVTWGRLIGYYEPPRPGGQAATAADVQTTARASAAR